MKENSPACASAASTTNALLNGNPSASTMPVAASALPARMTSSTPATMRGSRTMIEGSNSMPTDTKKSTANASCNGSRLAAALWLRADPLRTTPAKNAPSAKDTPKSRAEPYATDSTAGVKPPRVC